ncbi:fungal-specific transcription factor domain-containing protein [Aspergillus carlsbadensis]|nr:fungal-specific transcription factor domain-containing protein [Aspergillus carlsbadensis]
MEDRFGFYASVNQYRRQFKEWAFGKYHTSGKWKIIGYKVRKRHRQGKETVVLVNGEVIAAKKVTKETSRHAFTTLEALRFDHTTAPPTPEGFSIRTPPEIIVLSSDNEDEGCHPSWDEQLASAVTDLDNQTHAVSQAIHFMVDGIETDYDRTVIGNFARSAGALVRVLNDQDNPFKQMTPRDFLVLQSLMCLPSLHSLIAHKLRGRQQCRIYHIYNTVNQLVDAFYARLSRELDLQESTVVASLSLAWATVHLAQTGHNLTSDTVHIIGTHSPKAQRLQRFVTEFFNHYHRHYFRPLAAHYFHHSQMNRHSKLSLLDFLGAHHVGDFAHAFDGLLQCLLQVTRFRDRVRERRKRDSPPFLLSEELTVEAENMDAAIRTWRVPDSFTESGCHLAELYRRSAWAYLYRTIREPEADDKFQQVVDDGLECLEQLPSDLRFQQLIAMPLFLLASAAFGQLQRERIEGILDELTATSGWSGTEKMRAVIQEIWEVTDEDPESAWDWEVIVSRKGIDLDERLGEAS